MASLEKSTTRLTPNPSREDLSDGNLYVLPTAKAGGFRGETYPDFKVQVLGVVPNALGTLPCSGPRHTAHLNKP